MLPEIQETPAIQTPNFILPEDIKVACEEVAKRCFEHTDPTKISHIKIPNDRKTFKLVKSGEPIEVLISMICRPTLNVCELIGDDDGEIFSIELPLNTVQQKLSPTEISAEVILQHILFSGGYMDRSFMIGLDFLHGESTRFNAPVNMRYSETSYAIFDIETNDPTFPRYTSTKDLLKNMWKAVLCLYDRDPDSDSVESDYRFFLESGRIDGNFGRHLTRKSQEILEQYHHERGEKLFFEQCRKSQVQEDYNTLYESFINNTMLVHQIFLENSEALEDYICFDIRLAYQDIYGHIRAIGRIIRYLLKGKY